MENNKYTMEDIAQFLIDYNECNKYNSKEWLVNIPIVGSKLYEKTVLENSKREFFERKYNEALTATEKEQIEFIKQMTPILDDFYSNKEKSKIGRR